MSKHTQGIFGTDIKPRRKVRIRKNRFRPQHTRWMFPAVFALITLAVIVVGIH